MLQRYRCTSRYIQAILPLDLGGESSLNTTRWKSNMAAVRATLRIVMTTGRLDKDSHNHPYHCPHQIHITSPRLSR